MPITRFSRFCAVSSTLLLMPFAPGMPAYGQDAQAAPVDGAAADPSSGGPAGAPAPTGGSRGGSWIDRLMEQDILDTLHRIWSATLFTAGDTDIKLNQIIIALLVVMIGLWIAKRIAAVISNRLVRVSRVGESVASTLSKIVYYIAAAVVILIAMQVAGIPTTIFTVLGGALAIGVGFGAQNLFNNLISGIIILTEKPIRRNDIIEIDDTEGTVAEIGNRRTRIRTPDGIDVLVPNSKFLENNVTNWTLYDSEVRGHVAVGVAYGSPTQQVRELLLRAAKEHEKIHTAPPPVVLFTEFGDNTLNFSLFFWLHVSRPLDRRQIESDLRFKIDELFNQAGVVIAFPQRDVHLDTPKPISVRVVNEGGTSA